MAVSTQNTAAVPRVPNFLSRARSVLSAWISQPQQVATVAPSSSAVTKCIAHRTCIREASLVVELGPGMGGTTQSLLQQMRSDSRLLAIEKTDSFIPSLQAIDDPRLRVQCGDAVDLSEHLATHGLGTPDVVVSGIPFSSVPPAVAQQIATSIHENLRSGGVFIAYQMRSTVRNFAEPAFGSADVDRVWWNLPPLKVFTWTR
ncbi:class I SAM-dependent methyltransferase [Roseimaritima ulvae]|uniref:16S ribosomal RNA methyltransferase KsgA/Dim1 family protein n=1 Tax=Roseimaritima ulvae TaxID=980254 RepID=A0A5B9R6H0_9BACT|nr:rRNA adenine N-6-methyltransferase family protein [Roseimaritima ulvae]QEG41883.1 16S ribosomal RNA methyltransferase KsgA/Dim1 family protein [Roseimaritima ulvae]